jgi:methionine-rich copper-binding protein CopC
MHAAVRLLIAMEIFGAAALLAVPAQAHAALLLSDPAAGSTVAAPKEIRLTFSEKVAQAFSGFDITMDDGMSVRLTGRLSEDGKTIIGTPTGPLASGAWKVSWHAASVEDGHSMEGSFKFTVK